jgi:Protein of unknown function (DUF3761)
MSSTWISRVPGFRSGRRWKQIVASTAYGVGALTVIGIAGGGSSTAQGHPTAQITAAPAAEATSSPTPTFVVATPVPTPATTPVVTPVPETPAPTPVTYVAPPTAPTTNASSAPSDPYAAATSAGASAVCADGTYSFSQHRSGTCSDHGGVHWWTGNLGAAGPGAH